MSISRRQFLKRSVVIAGASALATPTIALANQKQMGAIDAMMTRRSVRTFTEQTVTKEQIETIMRAAMNAPSAYNEQPWEFIIVDDRAKLEAIGKMHKYAPYTKNASVGILTCIDSEKIKHQEEYGVIDVTIATTNILTAAHALGLGAVWAGVYPNEEFVPLFVKEFNLPENITPLAWVPIGYPKTSPKPKDEYKKDRIRYNNWK